MKKGDDAVKTCPHCEEPITESDRTELRTHIEAGGSQLRPWHWECAARSVLGSLGHLRGKCSCYGGDEEDPPGMTKRQAARVALEYFQAKPPRSASEVCGG